MHHLDLAAFAARSLTLTSLFLAAGFIADTKADEPKAQLKSVSSNVATTSRPTDRTIPIKVVIGNADVPFDKLTGAEGYFSLVKNGKVVGTYSMGPGGVVQMPTPESGVYAIAARSLSGVAASGFAFFSSQPAADRDWQVSVSLIPIKDYPAAEALVLRAMSEKSEKPRAGQPITYDSSMTLPLNEGVFTVDANGEMRGRLIAFTEKPGVARTVPDLSVHLIKDGKVAAFAEANGEGVFEARNLKAGRYSLVVTGNRQLVMMSVLLKKRAPKLVPAGATASIIQNLLLGIAPVQAGGGNSVPSVGIVGEENSGTAAGQIGVGQGGPGGPGLGLGGGTGGGPGGGGTGGTGGGGGAPGGGSGILGAALGAGLGAAAGALAGSSDDDQPASP